MAGHIMITCPATHASVRTGYRAPPGSDIDGLKGIRLCPCPECHDEHIWNGKDAYWVEHHAAAPPSFWRGVRQLLRGSRHA